MINGHSRWTLNVSTGGLRAVSNGSFDLADQTIDARWTVAVDSETVQRWTAAGGAAVRLTGHIQGPLATAKWAFQTSFSEASFTTIQIANGSFNGNGVGVPPRRCKTVFDAHKIVLGPNAFDSAGFTINGSTALHNVSLSVNSTDYSLVAEGRGGLVEKNWKMTWSRFDLHAIQNWKLMRPFSSEVGPAHVVVSSFSIADGPTHFKTDFAMDNSQLKICQISARDFEIGNLSSVHLLKFPAKGLAQFEADVQGTVKAPAGVASFHIKDLELENALVGTIKGQARFSKEELSLTQVNLKAPQGNAALSGIVRFPSQNRKASEYDLQFTSHEWDIAPLLKRASLEIKASQLNANLKLRKDRRAFLAQGPVRFTATEINVLEQGVRLQDAVIELQGTGSTLQIRQAKAKSGKKGEVTLSGFINKSNSDVALKAHEFTFDTALGVSGRTNADLALKGSVDTPRLTGHVNILKADIMPSKKKKSSARKREDQATPAKESTPSQKPPSGLAMDVNVHFDNNVWYKEQQTAIETKGNVDIRKKSYETPLLFGTIETIRGDYIFYGRSFKIEQGRVVFAGEPEVNPSLDIKALYVETQSKTKIHLTVGGVLNQPQLTLASEPPLEQTDIISVLVTGKPMDEIGKDGGKKDSESQAMAKSMVANYFAEQVRQRLQSKTKIDVLRVNMKNSEETDLTVGKNISNRLFLAYDQTLGVNGERRVEAEYSLGHFWNLAGYTSNEGKYVIDLLYELGLR
jgi:translocation and assembly module TamB